MHHTIVALEGIVLAIPAFTIPQPHTASVTVHQTTTAQEGLERVKDATIIICTRFPITAALLDVNVTPHLQFIAQVGTGYDNIDIEACRKRGIVVSNTPGGNTDTVAEHALALFFAIRRNVVQMHSRTVAGEWKQTRSLTKYMRDGKQNPPIALSQELCGIVGYGRIGRKVAALMQALGVKVVVADRTRVNCVMTDDQYHVLERADTENPVRTPLEGVLKHCSTVILTCPLSSETSRLISTKELEFMRPDAVVVNVGRGGVVDEAAMVDALNSGKVYGYATDVFEVEPLGVQDSELISRLSAEGRFVASSHVAWFSEMTITNISKMLTDNVESWISRKPQNVIV